MAKNGKPKTGPCCNWKVTLEFTQDDGEGDGPSTTVISQSASWTKSSGGSPPQECIALTMSLIAKMMLVSGLIGASDEDLKATVDSFADIMDM